MNKIIIELLIAILRGILVILSDPEDKTLRRSYNRYANSTIKMVKGGEDE